MEARKEGRKNGGGGKEMRKQEMIEMMEMDSDTDRDRVL